MDNLFGDVQLFNNLDDLDEQNLFVNNFTLADHTKEDYLAGLHSHDQHFDTNHFIQLDPTLSSQSNHSQIDSSLDHTHSNIITGQSANFIQQNVNHPCNFDQTNFSPPPNVDQLVANCVNESTDDEFGDLDVQTLKKFFYSQDDENFINEYLSDCDLLSANHSDFGLLGVDDPNLNKGDLEENRLEQKCLIDNQLDNSNEIKHVFNLDEYIKFESIVDQTCNPKKSSYQTKKVIKCTLCKYSSIDKSKVKRHNLSHAGQKSLACIYCGSRFNQPGSLKFHLNTVHQVNKFESANRTSFVEMERPKLNEEKFHWINNKENRHLNYQMNNQFTHRMDNRTVNDSEMSNQMNNQITHDQMIHNQMTYNQMNQSVMNTNNMNQSNSQPMNYQMMQPINNNAFMPDQMTNLEYRMNHSNTELNYKRINNDKMFDYGNLFDFMY